MKKFAWVFQKLLKKIISKFSYPQEFIQLNQVIPGNIKNFRVLGYSNEKIGLNQYKQVSEFRAIFEIEHPVVNPKSGVTWFRNQIVAESSIWHPSDLKKFEPKPRFTVLVESPVVVLPDNGYFHFLVEDLPRYLEAIEFFPNSLSIYSSRSSNYVKDFFQINQCQSRSVNTPIKAQSLILSERIRGGVLSAFDLTLLKDFQKKVHAGTQRDRKIFVYRSDKPGTDSYRQRGLSSQNQIMIEMEKQGFEIVALEKLSLLAQIELFSAANMVAGFHGAGLANQIWMRPGSKVIEFTGLRRTRHFSHLASLSGHAYSEVSVVQGGY